MCGQMEFPRTAETVPTGMLRSLLPGSTMKGRIYFIYFDSVHQRMLFQKDLMILDEIERFG